jgi:hypothetical protein
LIAHNRFIKLERKGLARQLAGKPILIIKVAVISKIVDHVQDQGVSRRKSAAYTGVCEHFEGAHNEAIGR